MRETNRKRGLFAIFALLLCDISSFGMLIPLTPILAREFGEGGLKIGLLISIYSVVQFLLAPFWGRLSDILGRKPIILLGLLGSAGAHLLFAFSENWTEIFLSRILAGFFGANIVIAMAYIADITSQHHRSKNLGLVGMAFGAGFTLGPLLGFLFILFGKQLGSAPPYGANFAAIGSVLLCLMNFLVSFVFLKESLRSRKSFSHFLKKENSFLFRRPSFYIIWESLRSPGLGVVLIMSFILWLSLAQIEPVLILLVQDDFLWNKQMAYGSFIYIGLLMVFSQGYLVRKWIPLWGEGFINRWGLFTMSIGLIAIAGAGFLVSPFSAFFSPAFFALLFGVSFFAIGYSLSNTSLNGALSLMTTDKEQGKIFGVNQSLSAMARIIGPALGGWAYQYFSHESPFVFAGLLTLGALLIAFFARKDFPNKGQTIKRKKRAEEEDFYSLDRYQLKNLIDKNISFLFFQLGEFSCSLDKETERLLIKRQKKNKEEIFSALKNQDRQNALVLICEEGKSSKEMSAQLREQGFVNAYYIGGGLKALLKPANDQI